VCSRIRPSTRASGFRCSRRGSRRAVVAARAGALPEIAGDAALLVDPFDVDALAGALERALDDEAARRARRPGTVRLATFSWEATAEGIAAIYRRAMEDKPR
jgi:glycosyltransferase involved in cell wall biosynthesis